MADYSLDSDNQKKYEEKAHAWKTTSGLWNKARSALLLKRQVKIFSGGIQRISETKLKTLFTDSLNRVKVKRSNGKRTFYRERDNTIYLAADASSSTMAHELFHEIDNRYGVINNGALAKEIKNDYKRLIRLSRKHGKSIEDMLYYKYPEAFELGRRGFKLREGYRGISDILNGMSVGKIRLGYRHEDSYWEKDKRLESEAWAQYGRMLFQDDEDVLEFARILFPETTEEVFRILKEMTK